MSKISTGEKYVLAYCAGVIDSDGTIGIKRLTYSMRVVGDSAQATYTARICVRQVEREAVDLLQQTFGGAVRICKPQTPNSRPLFQWEVRDLIAERALRALLPFLRIKVAQAKNGLALRELIVQSKKVRVALGRKHVGAATRPLELSNAMEQAYLEAKRLNTVGVRERRLLCP